MTTPLHRARLNKYALGTALALVIAPFADVESAMAACDQTSPINNATVNCGTTTNANGNNGFGTSTDNGNNITVATGATVAGTANGIIFNTGTVTVNNLGTVTGGANGIFGNTSATVTNNAGGSITTTGANANAVSAFGIVLTNSGSITAQGGNSTGVNSGLGGANIVNTGTITANGVSSFGMNIGGGPVNNSGTISATGTGGVGIQSSGVTLTNSGQIQADTIGVFGEASTNVTNTAGASITASAAGGIAVKANDDATINNAGTITASGTSGTGVSALGSDVTVSNTGNASSITGGAFGINADTVNLANAGTVQALGAGSIAIDASSTVSITGNAGMISAGGTAINASQANITNLANGTIQATGNAGVAIGVSTLTLANAGQVLATGSGGVAISGTTLNLTSNTGTISGDVFGILTRGTATITNNVGGTIKAAGVNGIALGSNAPIANTVSLANAGTVQALGAAGIAIQGQTINITSNTGTISGGALGINAAGTATITNNAGGTIQASGANGTAISGNSVTLANAGTIQANGSGGTGIFGHTINITANSGIISADSFAVNGAGSSLTVANSGQITSASSAAIFSNSGPTTVTNSGLISGRFGIVAGGPATITNFGTIQSTLGATGTAIALTSAADTLNIKNGSTIIGLIDMGHGADVINVDAPPSVAKGVSMLSRAAGAVVDALEQQLRNFDGIINIIGGNSVSGQPTVTANGLTASLDPTALAQQDRTLLDFTGGMSSMVQGRLAGASAGTSGPMAMSYAMEDARAQMFSKVQAASWNAPITVWSSAFGVARSQNGTDTTLDSSSSVFGGVIGVDRRIQPDWLIGAFAGGGSGTLNVELSSQKISTDYFSGGVYSRFEWASQFFDATLQAGGLNNRSDRLVQNNITGGLEHATASYNGWFISPEVAYGYRIHLGDTTVTPMLRARYVAGLLDGYSETGSVQTLSVGSRSLQDFEERAEVEVSKTGFFGDPSLKGWFRGGAIAFQRVGDTTINAVLIGQSLSFVTPGKSSAVGGVGSVGLDYHLTPNVALFGALEGMMMSDESRVGSARGGVKVAF